MAKKRHLKLERIVSESQLRGTYTNPDHADICLAHLRRYHVFPELTEANFASGKESELTFGNSVFPFLNTFGLLMYFSGSLNLEFNSGTAIKQTTGSVKVQTEMARNICDLVQEVLGFKLTRANKIKDLYNDKGMVIGTLDNDTVTFNEKSGVANLQPNKNYKAIILNDNSVGVPIPDRGIGELSYCNPVLIPELGIYGFINTDKKNHFIFGENSSYILRVIHLMGFHTSGKDTAEKRRSKASYGSTLPAYIKNSMTNFNEYDTTSQDKIRKMLRDMLIVLSDSKGRVVSAGTYQIRLLAQPSVEAMKAEGQIYINAINLAYPGIGFTFEKNFKVSEISHGRHYGSIHLDMEDMLRLTPHQGTKGYDSPFVTIHGSGPTNPFILTHGRSNLPGR